VPAINSSAAEATVEQDVTETPGVTRGQNAVFVLPHDWASIAHFVGPALERLDPAAPELQMLVVTADAESAAAVTAAVARLADATGLPILGICRGAQALNVARGGTLHQHLPAITDHSVDHRQTEPGWEETHPVRVAGDARLARVLGMDDLWVNSFHHQAVDRLGSGLRAVAWAPDGTVEGIEDPGERFVLGVQWHAETLDRGPVHPRLFEALVAAASDARLDLAA